MPDEKGEKQEKQKGKEAGEKLTFDSWHEQQPDEVKAMLDDHNKGLKSALESERTGRKAAEKELRDVAKKFEKGSDAQKEVEAMADKLRAAERRSTFKDAAYRAGCSDPHAAYLIAEDAGLVRDDGSADFAALKERIPQLFGQAKKVPDGKAGAGTDTSKPTKQDMNTWLRGGAPPA